MKMIYVLFFGFALAQVPPLDPELPWLLKTPAEMEVVLDELAQQPPYLT